MWNQLRIHGGPSKETLTGGWKDGNPSYAGLKYVVKPAKIQNSGNILQLEREKLQDKTCVLISIGFICAGNTGVGLHAGMNRNTEFQNSET